MPIGVGAALLASADGYTPRANAALDNAREELGTTGEIANALADNLPAPKLTARKSRRRRRKRKDRQQPAAAAANGDAATDGKSPETTGDDSSEPVPIVTEAASDEPAPESAEDAAA